MTQPPHSRDQEDSDEFPADDFADQPDGAERFIKTKTLSTLSEQLAGRAQALAADPEASAAIANAQGMTMPT